MQSVPVQRAELLEAFKSLPNRDLNRLQNARTLSRSMSVLLAAANGSVGEGSSNKLLRDQVFTLLPVKAITVREYGRSIFWKDEDKWARYYNS